MDHGLCPIVRAVTKSLTLGFVDWPIYENTKVRREGEVFCRRALAFYRKRSTACPSGRCDARSRCVARGSSHDEGHSFLSRDLLTDI
jgi:hypothetical protein